MKILKVMYGKGWLQWFFERLHRFSIRGMNIGNAGGISDSGEIKTIKWLLFKFMGQWWHKTVFDVGASVGDWSRAVRDLNPHTKIYAFEPSPTAYRDLRFVDGIEAHNMGMSNKVGEMTLYAPEAGSSGASVHERNLAHFGSSIASREKVQMTTIDTFCEQQGIKSIDLLKIDVEGHELAVLEGASKMLEKGLIGAIQFEFGGADIDSRTFFQDFWYLLHENFQIYRMLNPGVREITSYQETQEIFMVSNFLAIKRFKK